ncbi:hypothetical protein GCM10010919_30800 [Alishewanella longhuensis]|uniref:Uncharacterized protein n=1 Tax=Alishewanella longhuensis TaxID=1091037 RepID=A0ABQ3L2S1_9ALTE|nr:Spy/CpxP family protein refolding chaperone [Alishewanella longhuensis]GHG76158.1 hypothetical protein GCM10010919_30800 [Alishewanella longhuensis]
MKAKTLLITLSTLIALSGVAVADEMKHERKFKAHEQHNPAYMHKKIFSRLDLTSEQRTAIKELMVAQRQNRPERAAESRDRQAWQALMDAPQFDMTSARELLEKKQARQLERQLQAMQLQHQIRQLLTDEQRQQLDSQRGKARFERTKEERRVKPQNADS